MTNTSLIHSAVPVIPTDDIQKSVNYFVNILGFEPDFMFGNPPVYARVKSGEVEIYFSHDPDLANVLREKNVNPEIFIWVPDAESLFEKHLHQGAQIFETISDRPWGARQYVVHDINGYHLKFAQPI